MKKLFAMMLALVMVLAAVPVLAEGEETYVAKIGEQKYTTLDEAIEAAKDGDTIVLLADCETKGMNLKKNLSIDGGTDKHTVRFTHSFPGT